jgi:phosphoserine phosphatase
MKSEKPNIPYLDLLIIDIDDTFVYHRTVALANRIFLEEISGKKLDGFYTTKKALFLAPFLLRKINKRVFTLLFTAVRLYLLNLIRAINNRFFDIESCEKMIKIWADAVVKLKIKENRYILSKETIKNNLNKKILGICNSIKTEKTKIIAITEHFNIGQDPIKEVLGINKMISNKFITKNGIITDFRLNVKNKEDKFNIAKQFKVKNIGLIIEDYDDLGLLKLKNIKFVLYKKHLKRWIKNKGFYPVSF